jgi:hypothetical protein
VWRVYAEVAGVVGVVGITLEEAEFAAAPYADALRHDCGSGGGADDAPSFSPPWASRSRSREREDDFCFCFEDLKLGRGGGE